MCVCVCVYENYILNTEDIANVKKLIISFKEKSQSIELRNDHFILLSIYLTKRPNSLCVLWLEGTLESKW